MLNIAVARVSQNRNQYHCMQLYASSDGYWTDALVDDDRFQSIHTLVYAGCINRGPDECIAVAHVSQIRNYIRASLVV